MFIIVLTMFKDDWTSMCSFSASILTGVTELKHKFSWSWSFVKLQLNKLKPHSIERHSTGCCLSLKIQSNTMISEISAEGFIYLFIFLGNICVRPVPNNRKEQERDMRFYNTEVHFTWQMEKKTTTWNLPHMESNTWLDISAAFDLDLQAVHVGGAAGASAQRGAW